MDTDHEKPVVVGFDDSPDAGRALDWAVEHAARMRRPLRVVTARGDLFSLSSSSDAWTRELAERRLEAARKRLDEAGVAEVELVVRDGLPASVLVDESRTASCVVIGREFRGAVLEGLLGSVGHHVTRHAVCPVVVAHEPASGAKVVVGVDGSGSSIAALEFALSVAPAAADVEVVYCPEHEKWFDNWDEVEPAPELRAAVCARRAGVRERVLALGAARGPGLVLSEVDQKPSRALVEASREAALVVVGSRGCGGVAGALLGSVSADVVRHAHCSVAIVHEGGGAR
ncbi:universal stress protein [Marmoricola sp. RAF53]|uniref:universal stress protein n=1 Tax=Marmoricola sp. RAF53 TaxID=3233059 RepID=UPI003F9A036B